MEISRVPSETVLTGLPERKPCGCCSAPQSRRNGHLQTSRADITNLASQVAAVYGHVCDFGKGGKLVLGGWFVCFLNHCKDEVLVTTLPCWHYVM